MGELPAHAGFYLLGAGIAAGLCLVAAGIAGLVRRGLALRTRLEGYADLPLFTDVELAQARIAIGERALDTLPALQLRATRALRELDEARERMRASLFTVSTGVRLLFSLVFDES
jgi:hypothetical protein